MSAAVIDGQPQVPFKKKPPPSEMMNSVSAASWPTLTASLSLNMCCSNHNSNRRVAWVASRLLTGIRLPILLAGDAVAVDLEAVGVEAEAFPEAELVHVGVEGDIEHAVIFAALVEAAAIDEGLAVIGAADGDAAPWRAPDASLQGGRKPRPSWSGKAPGRCRCRRRRNRPWPRPATAARPTAIPPTSTAPCRVRRANSAGQFFKSSSVCKVPRPTVLLVVPDLCSGTLAQLVRCSSVVML